jgi:drug/metabolite transporter superfamily protein YnfA
MKLITFVKELYVRWTLEAPSFFKALIRFGTTMAVVGGILIASHSQASQLISPVLLDKLRIVGEHMAFAGGIVVAIAGAAVSDKDKLDEKLNRRK